MTDFCTNSEYMRRPDAKGHLKVMELLRKWDPIGVISENNQDEYDTYAPPIVRMLDAGIPENELFKHLQHIVTDGMGVPCDKKHTREISHELVAFWMKWKTNETLP